MSDSLSILHSVAGLHPKGGGPSRTVVQLADSLGRVPGVNITLLAQSEPASATVPSKTIAVNRRVCETNSRLSLQLGLPIRAELQKFSRRNRPSIIHSHGLWLPMNHWAARAARRLSVPLVIHPRGMLEPWAISHKSAKKRLAMALFQRYDIETAKVIIATSEQEYRNIRALGFRQAIAVIPNGIELESPDVRISPSRTTDRQRTALFLSRVHRKKGLLNLVAAWAKVRPDGWRLQIAGPDEDGHLQEVLAAAHKAGIAGSVEYVGEVDGLEKKVLYASADLFVLPTFSENFGVVVAEALSHGLPVITTRGAPWADLETYGCGWWIDVGVEPLANALRTATALGRDELSAKGACGRAYVQRYDWSDIAQQTLDVYRWILGESAKPDCLELA